MRGVRAASSCSIVTWNPLSASVSITTGTPPASVIASGYVVQYGAGQMTSSPGSHSAANAVYTACLPPLVTSTCDRGAVEPRVALGLGGDRLLQLGEPARRRVPVVAHLGARRDRRIDDVLRGREVRLAGTEPDHVLALGLQSLGLGVDRQGGRWCDRGESCGGSFHNRQACHSDPPLPTRFPAESGNSCRGVFRAPTPCTKYPTTRVTRLTGQRRGGIGGGNVTTTRHAVGP